MKILLVDTVGPESFALVAGLIGVAERVQPGSAPEVKRTRSIEDLGVVIDGRGCPWERPNVGAFVWGLEPDNVEAFVRDALDELATAYPDQLGVIVHPLPSGRMGYRHCLARELFFMAPLEGIEA